MAAIYMWFANEVQVLTTTLYPVEVVDGVTFNADISYGSLSLIPGEAHQNTSTLIGITQPIILISTNAPDEFHKNSSTLIGITQPIILLSTNAPDEFHQNSGTLVGITLPLKLVIVDTPDEKLQFACDIRPSGCSMTPV